jgi:hypothetical protein
MRVEVDANLARALTSLSAAESGTAEAMRASAAEKIGATWQSALIAGSTTKPERRLIAGGASRYTEVGLSEFTLFAGMGGPLSGGLGAGNKDWAGVEFGMTPFQSFNTKRRKRVRIAGSGREMTVATRIWVGKNLRPRNPRGYVALPAARTHGPDYVAAWVYGLIGQFDSVDGTALDIVKD